MKYKEELNRLLKQVSKVKKDDLIGLKNDVLEKAKKYKSEFDDHLLNAKETRLFKQEQDLAEKEIGLNKLEAELNQRELDLNRMENEIIQAHKKLAIRVFLALFFATVFYSVYETTTFQSSFEKMYSTVNQKIDDYLSLILDNFGHYLNKFIKNEPTE